jgi:hypothetical protein
MYYFAESTELRFFRSTVDISSGNQIKLIQIHSVGRIHNLFLLVLVVFGEFTVPHRIKFWKLFMSPREAEDVYYHMAIVSRTKFQKLRENKFK